MCEQCTGFAAPLLLALQGDECRIVITHDFHGNRLTRREKGNHVQLFMRGKVPLHFCKASFKPIHKLFCLTGVVGASGLDRGNIDLRKKAQETHLISIDTTTTRNNIPHR